MREWSVGFVSQCKAGRQRLNIFSSSFLPFLSLIFYQRRCAIALVTLSWSESQLREFLLEHGIVSPSGSIEQLRIAAKQQ